MNLKEKKLLIASIFLVLLSSWFIGNLIDFGMAETTGGFIDLQRGGDIALISTLVMILIPFSYLSYVSYRAKKESDFKFSKLLILAFWIFAFFGGLIFAILGFWPFTLLFEVFPNVALPFDIEFFTHHLFLDMGFILLLILSGLFFSIFLFIKIQERRKAIKRKGPDPHQGEKEVYLKKKVKDKSIEDSLSSTLSRAISEIGKGKDVREAIIEYYNEMTRLLEERGAKIQDSMTPREFKEEIIKEIPSAKDFISSITFLFEEARYSPHELKEKDREEVLNQLEALEDELNEEHR